MDDLTYKLKLLCNRNKEGAYATQAKRWDVLQLAAKQLRHELGYRHLLPDTLKPKHVYGLVDLWKSEEIADSTIATRMTHIRWWAEKVGKSHAVKKTNGEYGIGKRKFISEVSKAVMVADRTIEHIKDPHVQASLWMKKEFGLRVQEALLIKPNIADKGDHLWLQDSWCKGKRERVIPILTVTQREALDNAKKLVGDKSLIPQNKNLKQQLDHFGYITRKHHLYKLHGLRHRYAQLRYKELTGWASPHAGGPSQSELSLEKKAIDEQARLVITEELGHSRIGVVSTYIGI